jgi:integrase
MQDGQIKRRGASWVLRYYEPVIVGGKVARRRVVKRLAACSEYKDPTHPELLAQAQLILAPINAGSTQPSSADKLATFLEYKYLPHVQASKKPSTYKSYCDMWALVKGHIDGLELRKLRASDIDRILQDVAATKQRAHTTLRNARNFLSGGLRYAVRNDLIAANPARDAVVPRGLPKGETHAYTLDEIQRILAALPEGEARSAIAVISFTGLRVSELKGLKWADIVEGSLHVQRAVWWGKVTDTKTLHSAAPVPLLPIVHKALDAHRKTQPGSATYIFEGSTGQPLRLENDTRRTIRPALAKAKVQWHGWHAFRRGLATNLHALGVDDKTIQAILRHGNVATTQAHYVKTVGVQATAALRKLEKAFNGKGRRKK